MSLMLRLSYSERNVVCVLTVLLYVCFHLTYTAWALRRLYIYRSYHMLEIYSSDGMITCWANCTSCKYIHLYYLYFC